MWSKLAARSGIDFGRWASRELPARAGPLVRFHPLENLEHRVAVHLEDGFGELDAVVSAVALDLPFVRIELDLPDASAAEHGRGRLLERGEKVRRELRRVAA